jgi:hypothetical protein
MSTYLAERIAAVASLVEYSPDSRSSAVRWRFADTVVSIDPDQVLGPESRTRRLPPRVVFPPDSVRRDWLLIVGRRSDGQIVSTVSLDGGRAPTRCGGRDVNAYVLGAPMPTSLAGAGVFNLDGRVLGLVLACTGGYAAIPGAEVGRLLSDPEEPADLVRDRFGVGLAPIDTRLRGTVLGDSGLLVIEIRRAGAADDAGIWAGDVIVALDGRPVDSLADLEDLALAAPTDTHLVTVKRGAAGRTRLFRLTAASPADGAGGLGIGLAPARRAEGVTVTSVASGSPGFRAGLRPGDRLLRIDHEPVTSALAARRLLARVRRDALLVFQRDSVERGVVLAQ